MRLAATLTTMREAERQPVAVRGTLRDSDERPCDIVILDVSTGGFRAELPAGATVAPGTRVRIAASAFGVHDAVAVRNEEGGTYGFAFARSIPPVVLDRLVGEQPSTVMPFPGAVRPAAAPTVVPAPIAATTPRISARASLAIMVAISCALWIASAAAVAALSFLA